MKKSMTVKKKKKVDKVTQHMADVIEMNLEEVSGVKRAIFDLKSSRVDLEIEEEAMDDLSLVELNRAVIKTGWFDVL
jgi:NACalpha-BTF3-like transcription factor